MNHTLYTHPDGYRIRYSDLTRTLECFDEADGYVLEVPIGESGLIDFGLALVKLAFELRSTKEVAHE